MIGADQNKAHAADEEECNPLVAIAVPSNRHQALRCAVLLSSTGKSRGKFGHHIIVGILLPTVLRFLIIDSLSVQLHWDTGRYDVVDDWPPSAILDSLLGKGRISDEKPKRVVVTATNAAYSYFSDNWANSLTELNVTNFLLVTLDDQAYKLLHNAYPKNTLPPLPTAKSMMHGPAHYGTTSFKMITSTRPTFLRYLIERGVGVFYNDVDMVWRRNAWDELDRLDPLSNKVKIWEDGNTQLCSCLLYLPPNAYSLELLHEWEKEIKSKKHIDDQPAMNTAAITLGIERVWRLSRESDDVQIFRNSEKFPTGKSYFDEGGDKTSAVIIHNNWISGMFSKRSRFEQNGLWKLSGRLPPEPELKPDGPVRAKRLKDWSATVTTNSYAQANERRNGIGA